VGLLVCAHAAQNPGERLPTVERVALPLVDFASARAWTGPGVTQETLNVEIGSVREAHAVATLRGTGAELTVPLRLDPAALGNKGALIWLEIEEIHNRRADVFGYTVAVNGTDLYFRTYEELAAGANRFFVAVPTALVPDGRMVVTFRNAGAAPFSVSRVWAYADFFRLAESENTWKPLVVVEEAAVLLGKLAPKGAEITWEMRQRMAPETRAAAWAELKARMAGTGYAPGQAALVPYAFAPFDQVDTQIDQTLASVGAQGIDAMLSFNGSEWGHHPNGPDGLGGYFSDVTYSKVRWDAVTRSYRPCWPGTPGGTTWPTWNHRQLNDYLRYRLDQAVRVYVDRRDLQQARGVTLPMPLINQEWCMSDGRDCNDATVEAARRDGVAYQPEDGYSAEEKRWVFQMMARVAERADDGFAKTVGRDSIRVDRGTVRLPEEQTVDSFYFHTWPDPVDPYRDPRWANWQQGVGRQVWASGEYLPHLPRAFYDYLAARGRLACPNLERMALPTLEYLETSYQRGLLAHALINTRSGDAELFLANAAGMDARPAEPALHADRKLLEVRLVEPGGFGPAGAVVAHEHLRRLPGDFVTPDALAPVDATRPGSIVYRVPVDAGLRGLGEVLFACVAKLAKEKEAVIELAAGPSVEALTPRATLRAADLQTQPHYPWKSSATVNLGGGLRSGEAFFVRVTLRAQAADAAKLETFHLAAPWPQRSGPLDGARLSARQARLFSLWQQERAVFERRRALTTTADVSADVLAQVDRLAAQGRCVTPYRHLAGEVSLRQPARFAVRGHGRLGTYFIIVQLASPNHGAVIELLASAGEEVAFRVVAEKAQPVSLTIGGLVADRRYRMEGPAAGVYRVVAASGDAGMPAKNGIARFQLTPAAWQASERTVLPSQFEGMVLESRPGGLLIETQDPALWRENPIVVPVAADAVQTREDPLSPGRAFHSAPVRFDHVVMTVDPQGRATRVEARFGQDRGRVVRFLRPVLKGETHNGILELDNGRRYEFANMWGFTTLDVPGLKPFIRFNTFEQLEKAFAPGTVVELGFTPYATHGRLPRLTRVKVAPNRHSALQRAGISK
jgi:hypothetical protein